MTNRILHGLCWLRHYLYRKTGVTYGPWPCNKLYDRGEFDFFPAVEIW